MPHLAQESAGVGLRSSASTRGVEEVRRRRRPPSLGRGRSGLDGGRPGSGIVRRTDDSAAGLRGAGRVVGSHHTARAAFRLTGLFVVWAIAWAVVRPVAGEGTWWGPLHVFLVGGVLLAISGATQMFSITWAAATPPDRRPAAAQRWVTAAGATSAV